MEGVIWKCSTLWFQLWDVLEEAGLWRPQKDQWLWGRGMDGWGQKGFRAVKPFCSVWCYNGGWTILCCESPQDLTTERVSLRVSSCYSVTQECPTLCDPVDCKESDTTDDWTDWMNPMHKTEKCWFMQDISEAGWFFFFPFLFLSSLNGKKNMTYVKQVYFYFLTKHI